jgi:hypothetical protein
MPLNVKLLVDLTDTVESLPSIMPDALSPLLTSRPTKVPALSMFDEPISILLVVGELPEEGVDASIDIPRVAVKESEAPVVMLWAYIVTLLPLKVSPVPDVTFPVGFFVPVLPPYAWIVTPLHEKEEFLAMSDTLFPMFISPPEVVLIPHLRLGLLALGLFALAVFRPMLLAYRLELLAILSKP